LEKDIQVKLIHGLHARPSMAIVTGLTKLDTESVTISTNQVTANARSIMELLTSAFLVGTIVHVKASGKDAEAAIKVIEDVLTKDAIL
jgi:phosphotransferase system HPr (HPr) family protein